VSGDTLFQRTSPLCTCQLSSILPKLWTSLSIIQTKDLCYHNIIFWLHQHILLNFNQPANKLVLITYSHYIMVVGHPRTLFLLAELFSLCMCSIGDRKETLAPYQECVLQLPSNQTLRYNVYSCLHSKLLFSASCTMNTKWRGTSPSMGK